jgi:CheY-like chemotaxis protein
MLNSVDEQRQFVTLLAHDICPVLQIQYAQGIFGNTLLTNTQDEASTAIAGRLFDLIIIDTDLNGFGLVSIAKSVGCINNNTPIIALTDKADSNQRSHLIAAGFDDCLLKPLTTDNLDEMISLWRKNDDLSSYLNSIQTLLAKCKNNRKLVLTLFNKLFEELPLQISCIEEALKNGQHQLAFDVTHKLNGSAKICCLQDLEESATALEACLIQKSHEYAEGYFLMLQQRISAVINQRHSILDHLNKS